MVIAISAGFLFHGSILSLALGLLPANGPMAVLAVLSGLILVVQILIPCFRQMKALLVHVNLLDFITPPHADSIKEDSDHDSPQ